MSDSASPNGFLENDDGLFISFNSPDYVIVDDIPGDSTNYVIDSEGNIGPLSITQWKGQYLVKAKSDWLDKAVFPVKFVLLRPQIPFAALV